MKNLWIIAKKELRTYFTSPIAYVVMTVFLVLVGFFFYSLMYWFNAQSMQMAQNQYYASQININQMLFSPLFHNISIILLLMLPLLTMRLFAEEKKIGTEELLYTSPISVGEIIIGKFIASLLVLAAMLALTGLLAVFTFLTETPSSPLSSWVTWAFFFSARRSSPSDCFSRRSPITRSWPPS